MPKIQRIPEISDERLAELNARIKPVVRMARIRTWMDHGDFVTGSHLLGKWQPWDQGELFYIKPCDLRTVAFPWAAKRTKKANKLVEIGRITTHHTYGYYGFFKPSIAEVLAVVQSHPDIDRVVAYEVCGPSNADDLGKQRDAINDGYHQATTILYGKK
jgi:hypothetical protein